MKRRSKKTVRLLFISVAALICSSCGSTLPKSIQHDVDSKKVTYIGSTAILISITKLHSAKTAEGKLQVKLNIANKTFAPRRNIWVEVMVMFKDSGGFVLNSTEWQSLMVSKDSELAYSVVSPDAHADDFSISIRKR